MGEHIRKAICRAFLGTSWELRGSQGCGVKWTDVEGLWRARSVRRSVGVALSFTTTPACQEAPPR